MTRSLNGAVVAIVGFTATVTLARFIVAENEDSDIGRPARLSSGLVSTDGPGPDPQREGQR